MLCCYSPQAEWVTQAKDLLEPPDTIIGYKDGVAHKLKLRDILYFEVVEGRGFLYTQSAVYENRMKLYEFENMAMQDGFFRASRSMLVNAECVIQIRPSISGRLQAILSNKEKIIVSRQYAGGLKRVMGI